MARQKKNTKAMMTILLMIVVLAGSTVFLSPAVLASQILISEEPLAGDGASIEFKNGETDSFVEGAKLFTDRDYAVEETPSWLQGEKFLRSSIDGCKFRVTAPGVLTVLTPDIQTNAAASQAGTLEKLGFTRIENPSLIRLVNKKGYIFQKKVEAGEMFDIGKLSVVVGFSEAVKIKTEVKPWSANNGEKLYNGIVLPEQWPPRYDRDPNEPMPVPYLKDVPAIIPIDVGRQLFVDDFLIQETTLSRMFHRPELYPVNPVLKPDKSWENRNGGWFATPFSGGAWFDSSDKLFKMWYTNGYFVSLCYATSKDGINWEKPCFDVIEAGTNIVINPAEMRTDFSPKPTDYDGIKTFDSTTVWLDEQETNPKMRFKFFGVERKPKWNMTYRASADGIHWSEPLAVGKNIQDRSTVFYNPFRKVWVHSEKISWNGRARAYSENADPRKLLTESLDSVKWIAADKLDPRHPVKEYAAQPQIYNFDAAPYESIMIGYYSVWMGPPNRYCVEHKIQKRTDLLIGFSRDGFHFDRPDRERFISSTWDANDWRFGYVQSVGGGCLVVGDKLYFYFSGRAKPDAGFYNTATEKSAGEFYGAAAATGLAVLRRDGFASMDANDKGGTLTTRPVTFKGKYLFVNVDNPKGTLQAEVLDANNNVIEPFTKENCIIISADKTLQQVEWKNTKDLSSLSGKKVKIKFYLTNGSLYSFWVSPDENGASHGYVGAGGPGFTGLVDTVGKDTHTK